MVLRDLIKESVKRYSKKIFLVDREIYKRREYSYFEIYNRAVSICGYFYKNKIKKGDKILIYFANSSDYVSILWACALSGVIAVPIDINSNIDFVKLIYKKVNAKLIFCSILKSDDSCKNYFIEEIDKIYDDVNYNTYLTDEVINEDDLYEIIYTSGTTSDPKGVMVSNKNLLSNIKSAEEVIGKNLKGFSILSVLPLSHLFEQTAGFFTPISVGARITYILSKKSSAMISALKEEKIGAIITVPLFLASIKNKIDNNTKKKGLFEKLEKNRIKFRSYPKFIKKLIFNKIRKNLGNLSLVVSGGAALDNEVEMFWRDIGIDVLEGYGMTEASPLISVNRIDKFKQGSVGLVIPNGEIKIKEGEILFKGDNVFVGYYENKKETDKVIVDGWLHTGDIGEIDAEGFLKITGRKKNMILSPSGLNVYPEDIEKVINSIPIVKESVVLGTNNGKSLVGVILVNEGNNFNEKELLIEINLKLQSNQILNKILIWKDKDFPRTPSRKIIRRKIEEIIKEGANEKKENGGDILLNIISDVCDINYKSIKEDSILSSLGLDSIRRIELAIKIEELYDIEFNEDLINEKSNVKDLRKFITDSSQINYKSGINFLNSKYFNPIRYILQSISFMTIRIFYPIKVKGIENLPKNERIIFVSNHSSQFDTVTLLKALPFNYRMNTFVAGAKDFFFAKDAKYKYLGLVGRCLFNAFSFSRIGEIKQSLRDFSKIMDKGGNVLIYPEGTRSINGKLLAFKTGIGLLEWNLNTVVVPIKTKGLYEVLPKGRRFPKKGNVEVIIGKPLKFNKMNNPFEITNMIRKEMENL